MNKSMLALAIWCTLFANASLSNAQFVEQALYNPTTGNIRLQGARMIDFFRLSGPAVPVNAPNPLGYKGGFKDTSIPNQLDYFLFTFMNGELDVGNVFPTGLLQEELEANYFFGIGCECTSPVPRPIVGGLQVP